jgi:hypothetical protein
MGCYLLRRIPDFVRSPSIHSRVSDNWGKLTRTHADPRKCCGKESAFGPLGSGKTMKASAEPPLICTTNREAIERHGLATKVRDGWHSGMASAGRREGPDRSQCEGRSFRIREAGWAGLCVTERAQGDASGDCRKRKRRTCWALIIRSLL